jgi:hypothetical protein
MNIDFNFVLDGNSIVSFLNNVVVFTSPIAMLAGLYLISLSLKGTLKFDTQNKWDKIFITLVLLDYTWSLKPYAVKFISMLTNL